ncbi:protein spinster homolog 3 isoform X2 [Lutra lutra]|uniref:protein spinster homolog 3 isoform X2 n=1 Tax=Lutra lutra TaxID=9657 RepID=UPI001FD43D40|nr:protein spinster homolog 3 isoform X2 [Lutra lutra]
MEAGRGGRPQRRRVQASRCTCREGNGDARVPVRAASPGDARQLLPLAGQPPGSFVPPRVGESASLSEQHHGRGPGLAADPAKPCWRPSHGPTALASHRPHRPSRGAAAKSDPAGRREEAGFCRDRVLAGSPGGPPELPRGRVRPHSRPQPRGHLGGCSERCTEPARPSTPLTWGVGLWVRRRSGGVGVHFPPPGPRPLLRCPLWHPSPVPRGGQEARAPSRCSGECMRPCPSPPVFVCCLLLSAPVFGYLGDRHSRKAALSIGILLWSGAGLSSSFISPQYSWLFFLSRGVVGIGSASFSTIAPTVLGDLFVRDQRTRVLAVFYIFIPVGSGLGYVLGSAVLQLTGSWRWAFRVMPCLEVVAFILLIVLVPDPPRGAAEKQEEAAVGDPRSSWCEDVSYLGRNWSFVWSTLGVTAIAFVTGALGFWAPKFLFEARVVHGLQPPCLQDPCNSQDSLIFGILTVVTGIIGVVLGAEAARRYKKVNPRAEPLICAFSLLAAAPCLFLALILARVTLLASYVFLVLGELLLSCNWAVVADILLSVVVPRCRGTAEALQITVGHVLGDAGSPYLTGLISGILRAARRDSYLQSFLSLQHSFLGCAFVIALGGGCFLLTALRLEMDQARARQPGTGTPDSKDAESQALLSGTGSVAKDL